MLLGNANPESNKAEGGDASINEKQQSIPQKTLEGPISTEDDLLSVKENSKESEQSPRIKVHEKPSVHMTTLQDGTDTVLTATRVLSNLPSLDDADVTVIAPPKKKEKPLPFTLTNFLNENYYKKVSESIESDRKNGSINMADGDEYNSYIS